MARTLAADPRRGPAYRLARAYIERARERTPVVVTPPRAPAGPSIGPVATKRRVNNPNPIRKLPDPPHGTRARYNSRYGPCRCATCNAANTEYMRRYRNGRVAAGGTTKVGVARVSVGPVQVRPAIQLELPGQ